MKILGERLKQLREENGMTKVRIAELFDLPQSSIYRYENGSYSPTPETLLRYAELFDVSLDYLFGRTDNPQGKQFGYQPKTDFEMQKIIESLFEPGTRMNRELKQSVLKILSEERAPYAVKGEGDE